MTQPAAAGAQVRLLGPIEVAAGDMVRSVAGLRRNAVLAVLGIHAGEVVSADRLIDAVWNGNAPNKALNTLQSHISYIRRELGLTDAIVVRAPGYILDLGQADTDVNTAERLIREARSASEPAVAAAKFTSALALWRGRALSDVTELRWLDEQAERLEQVRRAAVAALTDARLALGEHALLVPELLDLTAQHQFDEDLHAQLMIALYRSGRQTDALAAYRQLAHRLADELGVDPSPALRDLEASILRQDAGLNPPRTPADRVERIDLRRDQTPAGNGFPHLIERTAETALIDDALSRAATNRSGSTVILDGPAGIGKTSLLDRARLLATDRGFVVVAARGMDLERDNAWGCVRQLFERFNDGSDTSSRPIGSGAAEDSASSAEYPRLHSLFWLASDQAMRTPLLIVADDLQWFDVPSARFLAYLTARLDGLPIVILAGTRPGSERLDHIISAMVNQPNSEIRYLAPLSVDGTAELLRDVVASDPDDALIARCHDVTRGNPFLLRELVRELVATPDTRKLGDILSRGVPSIARHVGQRLQHLSAEASPIGQALAVLGDESTVGALISVAAVPLTSALEGLSSLVAAGLVDASGTPERYSFAHPLIQAAVYDTIRAIDKAELHLRAARTAMRASDVVKAAAHVLRIPPDFGDIDATAILSAAADSALARGSVDSAVTYLRRNLDEDLGDQRLGALARLGMAEVLVDTAQACVHLEAALALEPDPALRAQLTLALAGAMSFGGRGIEAVKICQAALARDDVDSISSRRALQACIVIIAAATRQGPDLARIVRELAIEAPDPSPGGLMLDGALSIIDTLQNNRATAQRRALRAIADNTLIGQSGAETTMASAWSTLEMCDAPQVLPSLDAAIDHAQTSGSLRALSLAACFRSATMYARGHLADALHDGRTAWTAAKSTSVVNALAFIGNYLTMVHVARGDLNAAEAVLDQTYADCSSTSPDYLFAGGEIMLLLARGKTDRALARTWDAKGECESYGVVTMMYCDWRSYLVRCLTHLERWDEADEVAADLRRVATAWGTRRATGKSLRIAALTVSGQRHLDMLEESVRILAPSDARLEYAESSYRFGDALRRANHLVDARAHLQRALDLADLCEAKPLCEDAAKGLRLCGARPRRTAIVGPESLAPSEARVANLAAQGMENREIAESLFLTVQTVDAHVSSTLRKLGLSERTELARVLDTATW